MENNDVFPIYSCASPQQVLEHLKPLVNFQKEGMSINNLKQMVEERLVPHLMKYNHPRFFSMFNDIPEKGAKFGAELALEYNQGVTDWYVSPGGAMLEKLCINTLCNLFGFNPGSDGTFMYSGTYANQEALYLALHWKAEQEGFNFAKEGLQGFDNPEQLIVLSSKDAHFSLKHAVRMLGLGEKNLFTLATDENRRIDVEQMKKTVDKLKEKYDIFCIVATTGTTSTGSIDPVIPISQICSNIKAWLHVDGAYGLAYSLIPEYKDKFSGIELADSVSWDPHKQFGVPIPNSILFLRRGEDFNRMFLHSDYLYREGDIEPSPGLKSPPSTRPFSALSLVTSILYQGMDGVIERLKSPLIAIKEFYNYLKVDPDIDLCHYPDTGIICFRIKSNRIPESQMNDFQKKIYDSVIAEGDCSISFTEIDEVAALRLVTVSSNSKSTILKKTLSDIKLIAKRIEKEYN